MKHFLQILFFLLTWFTNLANATPSVTKVALPNYEFTFSKIENIGFVFAELPVSGTLRGNDQLGLAQEKQKS